MSDGAKPYAAIARENEILRSVASAAIKLRYIGQQANRHDEALKSLWEEEPYMPRSLTGTLMYSQAFANAMKRFDDAVLAAADAGMDWAQDHRISIGAVK